MICIGCGLETRTPHPACEKRLAGARASAGAQGRAREDFRWCDLRGKQVPVQECVNYCPAPEARAVCAMDTGRAIANMEQKQRDAILQQPSIRTPGRRQ